MLRETTAFYNRVHELEQQRRPALLELAKKAGVAAEHTQPAKVIAENIAEHELRQSLAPDEPKKKGKK